MRSLLFEIQLTNKIAKILLTKKREIFLALFLIAILINRLLLSFSYYTEIGGSEQIFIYFIQKFSLNTPFWGDPETPPFNFCQYAPGYFFILNKLSFFVGIEPLKNVHQLYIFCRLINLSLNILSSYLIFIFLTKQFYVPRITSALFSLLSLSLFYVHNYCARPDSLKNVIFVFSMLLLYRSINKKTLFNYVVIAFLTFINIVVKQDAFIFIAAVWIFYLVQKDWNGLKINFLILLMLFTITSIYWGLQPFFLKNAIWGLNQGISIEYVLKMYKYLLIPRFLFFAVLFTYSVFSSNKQCRIDRSLSLICIILFIGSSITSLKWGSTPVYFLEFFQVLLMVIAINFSSKKTISTESSLLKVGVILLFTCSLFAYESTVGLVAIFDNTENEKHKSDYYTCSKLADWIRSNDKNKPGFNVLTFEKSLVSHLADKCIFPTYETEFPEYMYCGSIPFEKSNRPKQLFNYSTFSKAYVFDSLDYFVTKKADCDSIFLGINLTDRKKIMHFDDYTLYYK